MSLDHEPAPRSHAEALNHAAYWRHEAHAALSGTERRNRALARWYRCMRIARAIRLELTSALDALALSLRGCRS